MAFDWFPQQQPVQAGQQQDMGFVTRDELQSYIRSDAFRSVMKNQNADLYDFGKWTDYKPEIHAEFPPLSGSTSVDPSVGTTGVSSGRYTRIGDTVICDFLIRFGSGMDPGQGSYYVTGPVLADSRSLSTQSKSIYNFPYPQAFQGRFYAQGWDNVTAWPGNMMWGDIAIDSDPSTGKSYNPTKFLMVIGSDPTTVVNADPFANYQFPALFWDQWRLGYNAVWTNSTGQPKEGSILTGRVMYEASPSESQN